MMCVLLWLCTTSDRGPGDQTLPIITPAMVLSSDSFILFLSDNEEILEISNVRNLAIRQFLAHSSSSDG
jgi:hypothetical protein